MKVAIPSLICETVKIRSTLPALLRITHYDVSGQRVSCVTNVDGPHAQFSTQMLWPQSHWNSVISTSSASEQVALQYSCMDGIRHWHGK
jgi:hypothetical protein